MPDARKARYLAEADRLIREGDVVSARIILDVVAYAERYAQ